MPASCSAFGCKNRFKTGGTVQFFGFPLKNKDLLKSWVISVRRKDFTPTRSSKICSDHFKENDYLVRPGIYVKKLKQDAVPSIFPAFPSYLKENKSSRRVFKKRNICHSGMAIDRPIESTSGSSSTSNNEVHDEILPFQQQISVPCKEKKETQTEENAIEKKLKQKIKTLQQKIRRRNLKNNGALIYPSESVFKIIQATEVEISILK